MSDKMLIDRATVQQALDALYHMCENTTATDGYNQMQVADALLKLDRALAAPQPAKEPAGYANRGDLEQMQQHGGGTLLWSFEPDDSGDYAALYTTPQAPQPPVQHEPGVWPIDGGIAKQIADEAFVSYEVVQLIARRIIQTTPQAPQRVTNPEPLYELARVCFDAGIKHGQGAKNSWCTDGKAMAIIDRITKGPAA